MSIEFAEVLRTVQPRVGRSDQDLLEMIEEVVPRAIQLEQQRKQLFPIVDQTHAKFVTQFFVGIIRVPKRL